MTAKYENSPPPSDVEYEDDSPIFFALSRPQNVYVRGFISVDYSLIHPRLLGLESEVSNGIIENKANETIQEVVHKVNKDVIEKVKKLNVIEKVRQLNIIENEKPAFISVTDQNTTDITVYKRKSPHTEEETHSKVKGNPIEVLQNREYVACGVKRRKCHRQHQLKRAISSADSDESDIIGTTIQDLRYKLISKARLKKPKISHKDLDHHKPKLHKHSKVCHYKKRISVYDDDLSSNSDRSRSLDFYSRKTKRSRSISSDEGHSFLCGRSISPRASRRSISPRASRRSISPRASRRSISPRASRRSISPRASRHSISPRASLRSVSPRASHRSVSPRASLRSVSPRASRRSISPRVSRRGISPRVSRHGISPHASCDRRSRLRSPEIRVKQEVFSDDDKISYLGRRERLESDRFTESDEGRNSKWSSPKREERKEIKCEPTDSKDGKEFYGPDVFYCSFCKLTLNSELTWKSHLLGQRHAKAIRAQSVHEVARSSLLNPITSMTYSPVFEEGQRHDKPPPGMKRIELKERVASIQEVCDDLQYRQLVIGMRHVWEIKGEVDTTYYCNLCDAPCGSSSIMPHITGFKHRLMCLKEYFPQIYDRYKDAHKKSVEKVIEDKFSSHRRLFRKEKIRVFKDIPIIDFRKSSDFSRDQPGPSWQTPSFSQGKDETVIVKDDSGKPVVPSNQEFLDTEYADFHCTVCDSHMNNIQMWEAHIRGKRHLKNMKKDTQGVAATNKYIEAPPGTVSNLEKQIEEVCTNGEIIVGLKYIRENQGKNGNQYNCFPCGGCCSDIDIVDHILSMKHKIKYLEKMEVDGFKNSIIEINNIQVSNYYREQMVDEECIKMARKYGRGTPKVYYIKRDLRFGQL